MNAIFLIWINYLASPTQYSDSLIRLPPIGSQPGGGGRIAHRGNGTGANGWGAVMYSEKDRDYYQKRYDEEMRRAAGVDDDALRSLHARWAELYRRRLSQIWAQR